jgi:hypothetical protein
MISIQRTTVFFPWEWRTAFGFSVAHAGTRVWASCLIISWRPLLVRFGLDWLDRNGIEMFFNRVSSCLSS